MNNLRLLLALLILSIVLSGCSEKPEQREDLTSSKPLSSDRAELAVVEMPENGERIYLECIHGEGQLCIIAERALQKYLHMPVTTSSADPDSEEAKAIFTFHNVERTQITRTGGGIVATLPDSFKVDILISTPDHSLDESVFLFRPTLDSDALYRDVRGETDKFIDAFAEKLVEKIQEQ